jgi:hypothetical protein
MVNLGQWVFAPIVGIEPQELRAAFGQRLLLSQHLWIEHVRVHDLDLLTPYLSNIAMDPALQWGVYLSPPSEANEIWVAEQIVKVLTMFDFLTTRGPVQIPFATWAGGDLWQFRVGLDHGTLQHSLRGRVGHLKSGVSEQHFRKTWRMLERACGEDTGLLFCLERFTKALRHSDARDHVLDLAIALESTIRASTEVTYRFSLYLSLISSSNPKERQEAFRDFKLLYELRCSVAHGDSKGLRKKLNEWENRKDAITRRAKAAIWYYIQFLNLPSTTTWEDHLRGLALGAESFIGGA